MVTTVQPVQAAQPMPPYFSMPDEDLASLREFVSDVSTVASELIVLTTEKSTVAAHMIAETARIAKEAESDVTWDWAVRNGDIISLVATHLAASPTGIAISMPDEELIDRLIRAHCEYMEDICH